MSQHPRFLCLRPTLILCSFRVSPKLAERVLAKRTSGPVGEILLRGAHRWEALYVGKAEKSFRERLRDHEKLPDALALGLTHVHVRVAGAIEQTLLEGTLIAELQPPLNVQGK